MENMAQSSHFVERFPSNDDEISRHVDEPMDITEQQSVKNCSSYLELVNCVFKYLFIIFFEFFFIFHPELLKFY